MQLLPIIIFVAGIAGVGVLLVLAFSGPSAQKAQGRRLESLRIRHSASGEVVAQQRRIAMQGDTRLDSYFTQLLPKPAVLRQRLDQTGRSWTLGQYGMVSLGCVIVTTLLVWLAGLPLALSTLIGLVVGLGIPHKTISILIGRRVARFTAKFPDAIELLVRGLRSGLPISETLNVVGQEVPGPVGVEFRAIGDKIKIGRTMDAALQETADRLATPEFQFFVITLAIQRETGGNLAETLSNLAEVLRKRSQMKLKIRAMSSESKASAYIIGALPFIVFGMIYMINDHYMQGFFHEQRLIIAGLGGLVWMSLGAFIMAKMINFEI